MPDVIAEPPIADIAQAREPITLNLSEALSRISRDRMKGTQEAKKEPEKQPVEEAKTEPVVPVTEELKKVEPEKPVAEELKKDPEIKHNAGHFKVVTEARDAAIAEAAKLKLELETARRTAPEDVQQKLTDYEKQLEEVRKSEAELRAKVREVDVTLDPAYQEKYIKPIQANMQEVYKYLVDSGVEKKEASDLVAAWDLKGIANASAEMDEVSKQLMMATIRDTITIDKERQQQIKSPEDFAARRRMEAEQTSKRMVSDRERAAAEITAGLYDSTPVLREETHAPLRQAIETQLARAARGEIGVKELMGKLAQAEALQVAVTGQHSVLVEQAAKIEELEKKLAEQDKFIAGGALPKGEAAGGGEGEYVPLVKSLRVA